MYWLPLFLAVFLGRTLAHSWIEQLTVVINGIFTGENGYPRGYVPRNSQGFSDKAMVYLLPPSESYRTRVNSTDLICAPTQRTSSQTASYGRLQAMAGSRVALKYLENGHVTIPQNQHGKPPGAGTVYVFGTSHPSTNELLASVLEWTSEGLGGDGRGKLLAARTFDDGRCYQINKGSISLLRQKEFPDPFPDQPGSFHGQWCEIDFIVPRNVPVGSLYTVYWVWAWPTRAGVPGLPDGKDEYYTTCSDLNIITGPIRNGTSNSLSGQDPQTAALPGCPTTYTAYPLTT